MLKMSEALVLTKTSPQGEDKTQKNPQPQQFVPEKATSPVNVSVSGNLKLESHNEQKKGHDSFLQNPEWWLVAFTFALVYVTARLVSFTKKLWNATVTLSEEAKATSERQATETQDLLTNARSSTNAAFIAAEASRTSAELAHKEFIAAHRPKMVVRRLSWIKDAADSHIGVSYAIKNVGDGPGTVVAISAKIWLASSKENLPPIPPYPIAQDTKIALKSGDWIDSRHTMDDGLISDVAFNIGYENVKKGDPTPNILFLGYIDYVDNDGRKLQTGFLRKFDFGIGRFEPIPHSDYEYQD